MVLINDDSTLRRFFPNAWASVAGEKSFFERMEPFLSSAEDWLCINVADSDMILAEGSPNILEHARAAVVSLAMHAAAPSLDLALTANGFITAGTQNAVPISTQRMERLRRSLAANADSHINALLKSLHSLPSWQDSAQGEFFAASFFQDLDCITLFNFRGNEESEHSAHPAFDMFLSIREKAKEAERIFEMCYLSFSLLCSVRKRLLARKQLAADARIVQVVRDECAHYIRTGFHRDAPMRDLVDFVRTHPVEFPEWQVSPVAKLFDDHAFKNEKKSGGYFF